MNIFYLDEDPKLAAIYQYNKHVVANPKKEKIYEQRINKPN